MWLVITITIVNRCFLHAYITGSLFVIANTLFGIERSIFALVVLVGAIGAEFREHKLKNHNYPGDWFSAVRDSVITMSIIFFLFVLSRFSHVLSFSQKVTLLAGSIVLLHILILALGLLLKPSQKKHWEPKHFWDIVSNFLGPFLISPILFRLIS